MKPVVAIVGRANVGKSTLFNRIVGVKRSIVHDRPGVTRDRVFATAHLFKRDIWLVDTGGLEIAPEGTIDQIVSDQVMRAVAEADLLLFVVDGREGPTAADRDIARRFRKTGKPLILVVNKIDPGWSGAAAREGEFGEFGFDVVEEISAEHGAGADSLCQRIESLVPAEESAEPTPIVGCAVAFVGRPNVGKSSLINRLLGEPRLAVSEIPGTTRDVIDTAVTLDGRAYTLLDTAGIRRRGKVVDVVEHFSSVRALRAIDRADVVALVIDAKEEMTTQDQRIAAVVIENGRGLLVVANKWDLMTDSPSAKAEFREETYSQAAFLNFADIRFVSAKTGRGVAGILSAADRIRKASGRKRTPEELSAIFDRVIHGSSQPSTHGLRFFGLTQDEKRPSVLYVWCNDPRRSRADVERFWQKRLSEELDATGVPLRVVFRRKAGRTRPRSRGSK